MSSFSTTETVPLKRKEPERSKVRREKELMWSSRYKDKNVLKYICTFEPSISCSQLLSLQLLIVDTILKLWSCMLLGKTLYTVNFYITIGCSVDSGVYSQVQINFSDSLFVY